ncbi:toll/interleukin-1 receptor domain-containing protein [Evansella clarkii]|uniref:toll/interleukin-1 receptor domain-containing protein n=1 Tax=Evansella clarkii TaxID=79879 RepID=UPI001473DFC5|nr:toll/interleukin-1 receptor domain-containing protein [Evansella clarkii]
MRDRKSVFISYSWDSEKHQIWVRNLVNKLRKESGVEATYDQFLTQTSTTHLPQMMIERVRDSDFTIIVLTEKYSKKADNFEGGVGFENMSLLSLLQENSDKLIFIKRDSVNFNEVVPFHFKGYYAIDFSNDMNFEEKYEELVYRIYNVPLYEEAPLGPVPDLKPKTARDVEVKNPFSDSVIDIGRKVTDLDKDKFLQHKFMEIKTLLIQLFNQVKLKDQSFDYVVEEISSLKVFYKLYKNGVEVTGIKMWIGGLFGRGISLHFGKMIDISNDNAMNENIICEVNKNNQLILKMTMNMFGSHPTNANGIVEEIWKRQLKHYFN